MEKSYLSAICKEQVKLLADLPSILWVRQVAQSLVSELGLQRLLYPLAKLQETLVAQTGTITIKTLVEYPGTYKPW